MSSSSFTGTIKNFSPKPNEGYYGILIDNGQEEKWLNGEGDPKDSWAKGDRVKVKANMDRFIEIDEIDVIGQDSKGADQRRSGHPSGGGSESGGKADRNDSIIRQVAFKKAVDLVKDSDENYGVGSVNTVEQLTDEFHKILRGDPQ